MGLGLVTSRQLVGWPFSEILEIGERLQRLSFPPSTSGCSGPTDFYVRKSSPDQMPAPIARQSPQKTGPRPESWTDFEDRLWVVIDRHLHRVIDKIPRDSQPYLLLMHQLDLGHLPRAIEALKLFWRQHPAVRPREVQEVLNNLPRDAGLGSFTIAGEPPLYFPLGGSPASVIFNQVALTTLAIAILEGRKGPTLGEDFRDFPAPVLAELQEWRLRPDQVDRALKGDFEKLVPTGLEAPFEIYNLASIPDPLIDLTDDDDLLHLGKILIFRHLQLNGEEPEAIDLKRVEALARRLVSGPRAAPGK